MIKQLKIFMCSFLTLVAIGVFSVVISSQNNPSQNNYGDSCGQQVMVIQKTETKEVHLVYDFTRGTVSTVRIRKDYGEPDVAIQTKKLIP